MIFRLFVSLFLSFIISASYATGWVNLDASTALGNASLDNLISDSYGNIYVRTNKDSKFQIAQYNPRVASWKTIPLPTGIVPTVLLSDSCGDIDMLQYQSGQSDALWKYSLSHHTWMQPQNHDYVHIYPSLRDIDSMRDGAGNFYVSGVTMPKMDMTVWQYNCSANVWQDTHQKQGTGNQNNVMGMAIDHFGNNYITLWDGPNSTIWKYNSLYYDASTKQAGQWTNTHAHGFFINNTAADRSGNLYEVESTDGAMNLWRYTPKSNGWTEVRKDIVTGLNGAVVSSGAEMAFDSNGNVYLSASGAEQGKPWKNVVAIYHPSTNAWQNIAIPFSTSTSVGKILLDKDNNIYVMLFIGSGNYQLWKYDIASSSWMNLSISLNGSHLDGKIIKDNRGNFYVTTKDAKGVSNVWEYRP
jgi:hypothetical protein